MKVHLIAHHSVVSVKGNRRYTVSQVDDEEMSYREFIIRGKVHSPNVSVAKHRVYWAMADSQYQDEIIISDVEVVE